MAGRTVSRRSFLKGLGGIPLLLQVDGVGDVWTGPDAYQGRGLGALPNDWGGIPVRKGSLATYTVNVQEAWGDIRIAGQGFNLRPTGNIGSLVPGTCMRVTGTPYFDTRAQAAGILQTIDVVGAQQAPDSDYLSNADGTPSGISRCKALEVFTTAIGGSGDQGPTQEEIDAASRAQREAQEALDAAARAAGEAVGPGPGAATEDWQAEYDQWIIEQEAENQRRLDEALRQIGDTGGELPEGFDVGEPAQAGAGKSSALWALALVGAVLARNAGYL